MLLFLLPYPLSNHAVVWCVYKGKKISARCFPSKKKKTTRVSLLHSHFSIFSLSLVFDANVIGNSSEAIEKKSQNHSIHYSTWAVNTLHNFYAMLQRSVDGFLIWLKMKWGWIGGEGKADVRRYYAKWKVAALWYDEMRNLHVIQIENVFSSYWRTRVAFVARIESKLGSVWQIFHAGNLLILERTTILSACLSRRSRSTWMLNDSKIFFFNVRRL